MWLVLFKRYWRQIAVLTALLASFYAGRSSIGTTTSETKTSDKVSEQVADDKVERDTDVHKTDKVTTITKKPDGTTVTQIVDHSQTVDKKVETDDTNTKLNETKTTDTKVTAPAADPYMPNYSVGAMAKVNSSLMRTYEVTAGYRVLGNAWIQAGYDTEGSIGLGVRIDF